MVICRSDCALKPDHRLCSPWLGRYASAGLETRSDNVVPMSVPYTAIPVPRATPHVRRHIASLMPGGGKMKFSELCLTRPRVGHELLMGWADRLFPHAYKAFGEPVATVYAIGTVRYNTAEQTDFHQWHTDDWFFEPHCTGVTFWLTFDDVGVSAPSLEFDADGESHVPVVPAGTALMFNSKIKHRTQEISGERVSVEFRCAPLSVRTGNWLTAAQATVESGPSGPELVVSYQGNVIGRAAVD